MQQAEKCFIENAVLIGEFNEVTLRKALELFGRETVDYVLAKENKKGCVYHNKYGFGGPGSVEYFTRDGFMAAVTYNNVKDELTKE